MVHRLMPLILNVPTPSDFKWQRFTKILIVRSVHVVQLFTRVEYWRILNSMIRFNKSFAP